MKIQQIENPEFLKNYTIDECKTLANDIRGFLIESVSKTGGHLSSNLGVVELTIALHKVFNSPTDKFIFDVGHQSYTHKILTGRAKDFPTLRQTDGLSGFQKRNESIHDPWEAGHSSTSLSAALGMAVARDLNKEDYQVVAIIGDGAMASGMSLEALNHIGCEKRNLIVIFNDNNMSISKNVGALTKGFSRLRTSSQYTSFKHDVKESLGKNIVGKSILQGMTLIKDKFKETIVDSGIFSEFDLEYLGPVDGHNFDQLFHVLEAAKKHDGPVVVHVLTTKGLGYEYCEDDNQGIWHGVGPFDIKTGKALSTTPENCLSWSAIISDKLCKLANSNKDIVAITPAMMCGSKLERFFAQFPARSFDCGIAEEHAATFAAGLAINGKRPFLSIYSSFLQRCYDQINHDICRMDLPVVIGIDRAGLVGEDGPTHHGIFDISILRSLPNIILSQPKDSYEAKLLMNTAFNQSHPWAIRYPRGIVTFDKSDTNEIVEIGSWTMHNEKEENKIFLLSYGSDVDRLLSKIVINQLPVTVVNCRFFKPIDEKMLQYIANKNKHVIIYETDVEIGGLGSAILEWQQANNHQLSITRFGIGDNYVPQGSINHLRKSCQLDTQTLFDTIHTLLND